MKYRVIQTEYCINIQVCSRTRLYSINTNNDRIVNISLIKIFCNSQWILCSITNKYFWWCCPMLFDTFYIKVRIEEIYIHIYSNFHCTIFHLSWENNNVSYMFILHWSYMTQFQIFKCVLFIHKLDFILK